MHHTYINSCHPHSNTIGCSREVSLLLLLQSHPLPQTVSRSSQLNFPIDPFSLLHYTHSGPVHPLLLSGLPTPTICPTCRQRNPKDTWIRSHPSPAEPSCGTISLMLSQSPPTRPHRVCPWYFPDISSLTPLLTQLRPVSPNTSTESRPVWLHCSKRKGRWGTMYFQDRPTGFAHE